VADDSDRENGVAAMSRPLVLRLDADLFVADSPAPRPNLDRNRAVVIGRVLARASVAMERVSQARNRAWVEGARRLSDRIAEEF